MKNIKKKKLYKKTDDDTNRLHVVT